MKAKNLLMLIAVIVLLAATRASIVAQGEAPTAPDVVPLGTAITYQGRLSEGGSPANGSYDFQFILYNASSGGSQVGSTVSLEDILVTAGYFTVLLDFGPGVFGAEVRYLEVGVRPGGSAGDFTILSPRQQLTPAPGAVYASTAGNASSAPWSGLTGVPVGFADGIDNDTLASLHCSNGQIPKLSGGVWACVDYVINTYDAGIGLTLNGNAFNADTTYLQRRVSTTCVAGSSIRVINADGTVTCQPDTNTTYTAGMGLTLSGSAFSADTTYLQRRVSTTCAAGNSIRAIAADGSVTCQPDANTTYTTGTGLTLTGNAFSLGAAYSLPQGCGNGQVAGWNGSTWVCNNQSFWGLSGNAGTHPTTNYLGTSDNQPLELRVNGQRVLRLEPSTESPNLLGGYSGNTITAGVYGATISGGGWSGYVNSVTDIFGMIGGGLGNQVGDNDGNMTDAAYSTVGGGLGNTASGEIATVGGGSNNHASGDITAVGGGEGNIASGLDATVGGGWENEASGYSATVGGGYYNHAIGNYATVGGGFFNYASGDYATVGGGGYNYATGNYSFAAGYQAIAQNQGSFVWSDSLALPYDPYSYPEPGGGGNSFNVRAIGGIYFVTAINATTGRPTAGTYLSPGGSGWNIYSDPSFKQNFKLVDSQEILARLAGVPISTWNYKSQDSAILHVGPMAPDFNAAFGVGEPDKNGDLKYINSLDADGVALAAIQGLYQHSQAQDTQIQGLNERNQVQAVQIQALQGQLAQAQKPGGFSPSSPSGSLPGMWVAIAGFLGALVILQVGMFFAQRRRRGFTRSCGLRGNVYRPVHHRMVLHSPSAGHSARNQGKARELRVF